MVKKRKSLGFGFILELSKVTGRQKYFKNSSPESWEDRLIPNFDYKNGGLNFNIGWRITALASLSLVVFFSLFLKAFHLQIIEGSKNLSLADGNRIQIRTLHAPRGVIYDRNSEVLAANAPAFRLFDDPPAGHVPERYVAGGKKTRFITREQALELEVKKDPRAQNLEIDNVRTYPQGEKFAHILGYVGEISEEQLQNDKYQGYKAGDRIGKAGIEAEYEKILRGKDGGEIVEVDSKGVKIRTLRREPPIPGQNIYLTIDATLQSQIFNLTEDTLYKTGRCCAAALVNEPKSGKILALVSFPVFDPNAFSNPNNEGSISRILNHPDSPILNRAISGTYPPGSIYKIISSLAVLSSNKITPQTIFVDNGVLYLGIYKFTNWYFNQYGRTEGAVNLTKALQRSNDTYFYEAAKILGEQALVDWSKKLKLGEKLEIDLPSEERGLVPTDEWKRETFGEVWYPGDTLHMAIGQGFVLTTPLQILGITSFIATDGILYKPQLLEKITRGEQVVFEYNPKTLVSNIIPLEKIKVIKEGLNLVPKYGGTAWPFFTFPIATAGKTGTAEYGDPKNRVHAWYTGYAPSDNPQIAMTVLIEGGGEGSSVAAPIVKETFRWFFSQEKSKLIKDVYIPATESGRSLGE